MYGSGTSWVWAHGTVACEQSIAHYIITVGKHNNSCSFNIFSRLLSIS